MRLLPGLALLALVACGGGSQIPPTYSIGGMVSGITPGGSLILKNNGGDALTINSDGAFTFATKVASGGAYTVTATAPQGETCAVAGGSGVASADITSVAVSCGADFSIGGSVSGLVGHSLEIELSATGVDQILGISADGQFVFPLTPNSSGRYVVSVKQQPSSPSQLCQVGRGGFAAGGFIPGGDVTDIGVVCGEFAYVTNAVDGTVAAFSIDARSGAIAAVGAPAPAGRAPHALAHSSYTSGVGRYLYVVNGTSNDVSAFAADAGSGALAQVTGSPFMAGTRPSDVILYGVINPNDYSPPPERLRYYLYVANSGSDDLSAYRIDRGTGIPTLLSPATYATGTGPSVLAVHPGGFLYVANSGGSNDISVFSIDGMSGTLTPVAGSPFHSGARVSSVAFGADGKFLYAADASGGAAAIYGFSIDPNSGALTRLGSPLALPACSYIVADQTATRLYAAAGGSVFAYSVDQNTGALSPLPGFPVAAGASVDTLSIDPTDQFFYTGNRSAGTVMGFKLNTATGALTPIPGSPFAVGSAVDSIATF